MKQFTLQKYSLNDFADYLNGENDYFNGIEGEELLICGKQKLTKTLNLHFPIKIIGDNATIIGDDSGIYVANITSGDVFISNLEIREFYYGIEIDGFGKCVANVEISDIVFRGCINSVEVGSTMSHSILRDIYVVNCTAIVRRNDEWTDEALAPIPIPFNIGCGRQKAGDRITDCVLENFHLNGCKKIGESRAGLSFASGMPAGSNFAMITKGYDNLVIKDVYFTNNHFEQCWDCNINIAIKCREVLGATVDGMFIVGNYCEHGISAIGVFGGGPMFGESFGGTLKNVIIKDNHTIRTVKEVGEPDRAIWIDSARGDVFENVVVNDSEISDVEICGNKLEGSGIVLTSAYCMSDMKISMSNNILRDVNIHHNTIINADFPFEFYGAHLEGRLYDWNFGFPRHDMKWGEEVVDDSVITNTMQNNRIENLTVKDNEINGYRYRVKAYGATGHGHAVCKNNKVTGSIIFERNNYGVGENHIHVADFACDDFVRDEGGNFASKEFFKK